MVPIITTFALASGRKRLVYLAAAVCLTQLSGFYFASQWTLPEKAFYMMGLDAVLGACLLCIYTAAGARARLATPTSESVNNAAISGWLWLRPARGSLAIVLGGVIAVAAVLWDVRGKEQVIGQGQKIYIPLAPRDPRSIMQGDYMALNFGIFFNQPSRETALVWAKLDDRRVATQERNAPNLADQTLAKWVTLPLKYKNGRSVVVTDTDYFPEGQGEPFTKTRFGEIRILSDGRALLVGLADEQLNTIKPAPKSIKQP